VEVKDAAEGYLTPEEPNESQITKKRSFNSSCPNNSLQEFSRGRSFTFRPKPRSPTPLHPSAEERMPHERPQS
jgi:hypothetical protein